MSGVDVGLAILNKVPGVAEVRYTEGYEKITVAL